MKKKYLKTAVVGCGRVAEHYLKFFKKKQIKNIRLEAFCDLNLEKAKKFAKIFSCRHYKSYQLMLSENKFDLVLILTPSGSHYEQCKFFLKKNTNILCEKPLTLRPSQSIEIFNLAKKRKLMCGVLFQNRLNPSINLLKKAVDQKRFGKIVKVSISVLWCRYQEYYNDEWHGTWKNDGGVINQQAIHHIDVLRWLFGPVKKLSSTLTNRINKLEAEDTAAVILKFKDGCLGTIEATTAARPKDLHASLSVVGEKGTAVISGVALNEVKIWDFINKRKEDNNVKKEFSERVPNGYGFSHKTYLNIVSKNLLSGNISVPVSAKESYETTKIIHAIYLSDKKNKWIKINDKVLFDKLGKGKNKIK